MQRELLDAGLIAKQKKPERMQREPMKPELMKIAVQRTEHPLYGYVRQCRFREPTQD
jgi:hypothetical protein